MMRKLLIAAALLSTVACDDATVHELITSNFVCVYMAPWMGECDSTEMSAKAQSVLTNGLVEARVECTGQYLWQKRRGYNCGASSGWEDVMVDFTYRAVKLQDGGCFVKSAGAGRPPTLDQVQSVGASDTDLLSRSQTTASTCQVSLASDVQASVEDGVLTVHSDATSYLRDVECPHAVDTPDTVIDLESECTGFNLSAFGVEE